MRVSNRTGAKPHFDNVGSLYPERSAFDLSYSKTFTCDMGELIPIMVDEVVPGDVFKIGCESVIRFQPMVAPILHEVNQYVHYFFVPYRLLWDEWEDFITGGVTGNLSPALPRWQPVAGDVTTGKLWDYLGFPTGVTPTLAMECPIDFPRRAYNFVYNEYYRDETLQTEVDLSNVNILNRAWEKDYFTSALTSTQRGAAPAIPLTGFGSIQVPHQFQEAIAGDFGAIGVRQNAVDSSGYIQSSSSQGIANAESFFNDLDVDVSTIGMSITDLRLAVQIQRWLERNNRAGARYTEFLRAHFGVSPRDDRLQRPEYIGGTKAPVIVSEVLQTSSTDATSPQGHLAGHGMSVNQDHCGTYHAQEFGLIIGIMSVMPRSMYQQGINRQWMRRTKYDFYFREFANLSEQAIEKGELFLQTNNNQQIFGYAGRYDEMRVKNNMVCADMRDTLSYWHIGRKFAAMPALNGDFITCVPRKDIFAVQNVDTLIVSFANRIKALRPMPVIAEPGMMDHF